MKNHEAAYILRKAGASYKEIIGVVKVSENTLTAWSKKYNWEHRITEDTLFAETSTERVRKLIQHNLTILGAISERKMEAIKDLSKAEVVDLEKALTDKGSVDALQKLFTTIKGKELQWEKIVRIVRELSEFIDETNPDLAKQIQVYAHDFLDAKRKDA